MIGKYYFVLYCDWFINVLLDYFFKVIETYEVVKREKAYYTFSFNIMNMVI